MTKNEFLNKPCESNEQWVAQQILEHFPGKSLETLKSYFKKLDEAIYKSWAKDMTFNEIKQAIELINELK